MPRAWTPRVTLNAGVFRTFSASAATHSFVVSNFLIASFTVVGIAAGVARPRSRFDRCQFGHSFSSALIFSQDEVAAISETTRLPLHFKPRGTRERHRLGAVTGAEADGCGRVCSSLPPRGWRPWLLRGTGTARLARHLLRHETM